MHVGNQAVHLPGISKEEGMGELEQWKYAWPIRAFTTDDFREQASSYTGVLGKSPQESQRTEGFQRVTEDTGSTAFYK